MVLGSSPVAVTSTSDFALASREELLDIQATIECGFTLKPVRDMARKCSPLQMFEFFPAAPGFSIGMGNTFVRYCYDTVVINFQAIRSLT